MNRNTDYILGVPIPRIKGRRLRRYIVRYSITAMSLGMLKLPEEQRMPIRRGLIKRMEEYVILDDAIRHYRRGKE